MNVRRLFLALVMLATSLAWTQQYQYPFQNPSLPVEERINNILSLMTVDEKIAALSTNPDVPRLGIQGSKHIEGLHGVAYGGPGGWEGHGLQPHPTTQFPQSVGLGETWDPDQSREVHSTMLTRSPIPRETFALRLKALFSMPSS